ncbi:prefoldin subunit 4 isoform X2 [Eptesicus fuscus]|uniref:prefoldin subunit 4 isoform X2 n=1 Tax=Eptesicus fuscus TaxID=29078 RepID=UPI002403A993|nr:prefoldin subunit 4 isoform X2 [Eptesicus fuscus]
MAATMKKAAAEDVNVTFEDQQKINKFARNTSRITELKEEIDVKKKQLQNLEDACEDIMLADEDCLMIPYQIGDVFISHSQEETQEMLEEAKVLPGSLLWARNTDVKRTMFDDFNAMLVDIDSAHYPPSVSSIFLK